MVKHKTGQEVCINWGIKMELGNLVFGNSRGKYPMERGAGFEGELIHLVKVIDPKIDEWECIYGIDFENDIFSMFKYYWEECDCVEKSHKADCLAVRPNFLFKPTGLEIRYYKYILRDAYSNQQITLEEFKKVIDQCINSLGNNDRN